MPYFAQDFAMSQVIRCAPKNRVSARSVEVLAQRSNKTGGSKMLSKPIQRQAVWNDCDVKKVNPTELTLLGYSMRTLEYRYTAYYPFNRTQLRPDLRSSEPYEEELFDHKNESLSDFTHRETVNLAYKPNYAVVVSNYRAKMADFILTVAFRNPSPHANAKR
ncbi:hypothetical protein B484DRAFT_402065 [Ochromonadaceae sp. CCMP2298]|nr:hypothetical protein B484DRAFT_402065 [Ochromonadaceae sp. CCMP2298]